MGQLAAQYPEILAGSTSKRIAGADGPMLGAYLSVLNAIKMLRQATLSAGRGELCPRADTSHSASQIVPYRPKTGRIRSLRTLGKYLEIADESGAEEIAEKASSFNMASLFPSDCACFYTKHFKIVKGACASLVKYAPVVLLYGAFLYTFFVLRAVVNHPEILVDICLWLIEWLPTYLGFAIQRVLYRSTSAAQSGTWFLFFNYPERDKILNTLLRSVSLSLSLSH